MIYEGNLVNTVEDIQGKGFLSIDGNVYSDVPVIGYNIVDIPPIGKSYKNGILVDDIVYNNNIALQFLADTDYKIIRETEYRRVGKVYLADNELQELHELRQQAREVLNNVCK